MLRVPPVAPRLEPEAAIVDFNFIALPGTAVFVAAILSGLLAGLRLSTVWRTFVRTVRELFPSLASISFMVGLAYVTKYSGMDTVMGLSLTRTGSLLPVLRHPAGLAGGGPHRHRRRLERPVRQPPEGDRRAARDLSAVLMASANSAGGVMGKMIDAQSLVVSATATHQVGNEAAIFRAVIKHSIVLACLVGLVVTALRPAAARPHSRALTARRAGGRSPRCSSVCAGA